MILEQTVKANKMATVHGKNATILEHGKLKDAFIRPALSRLPRFQNG